MEPHPADSGSHSPSSSDAPAADGEPRRLRPTGNDRAVALIEVLLCSDYPTQLVIAQALYAAGLHATNADGTFNVVYITTLSLVDTVVLLTLVFLFLAARRERPRHVLFGDGPIAREVGAGLPLALISLLLAIAVLIAIRLLLPWLVTVTHNPLQDLLTTPANAIVFGIVAVVAGGVREELQRGFLLHRFEEFLGGGTVGIVVVSISFGLGHYVQGMDAVVTTAILGALWGVTYLRRRSAVAPMVAHAGFNLLQLAQFFAIGR